MAGTDSVNLLASLWALTVWTCYVAASIHGSKIKGAKIEQTALKTYHKWIFRGADCDCGPPPLPRTRVTYTGTKHNDVAHYSCSFTSDVYIKGTTQVYCRNGKWETPTILCAPTTCWYDHPTWGPVYKGKQAKTKLGYTCNVWTSDSPHNKANLYKDDKAYTVDGSKAAAVNFCRLFKDNHAQAWCYTTHSSKRWDNCDVPQCTEAQACNGPPPRLPRTRVTYTGTKHNDVAHYSCSFTSDVYIKGTTQVYCNNGKWETPTILCAPTTCWYDHPTWGPVYKGKQAKTKLGYTCNVWTSDSPHNKANLYKDDKAYTVDGSKAAAVNFCRLFKDNHAQAWCYTTHSSKRWDNCEVPHCNEAQDCNGPPPRLPRTRVTYTGTKHNDVAHYSCSFTSDVYIKGTTQVYCNNGKWQTPTILCASTTCWYDHPTWGPVYKGKQTKTKLGYTCNVWTSDSPHNKANLYKDDKAYTVDGSKAAAVNFCRLFKDNHAQAWCYTTHSSRRWDNCEVPHCNEAQDCNGPPPRLPRTRVTYTGTKHNDVAHYSCSFTSDVYIKGTTQVYCNNGKWETPTILCASTTCWYDHPTWGPVYKGKQAKTKLGYTCNVWTSDSPHNKANLYKDDKAYTVDGSKAAAVNFCRLFKDNHAQAWCYTTHSSKRWDNCEVPHCNEAQACNGPPPRLPRTRVTYTGTKHNDVAHYSCSFTSDVYIKGTTQVYCNNGKWETPTILCASTTCWYDHPTWGPVYKGKQAKTKLGYTCNVWTSDSPHNKANLYKDDKAYTVDGSKAAAVNFCRLFKDNHAQAWCYTTHSSKRWDNCEVPHCNEAQDCNGPPPRLPRTRVTYTGTKHNDVAHYSCSFTSDVYIKGTTQVYCNNGKWETPTILCASTTCWYDHPTWGPVYKGKQAKTKLGYTCNVWTSDSPHNKANLYKDDKAYTVDGSKAAAVNFCRLFKDNHAQAWCYTTHSSKRWDNCEVPHCNEAQACNGPPPRLPRTRVTYTGTKHNDVAHYSCSFTSDVYIKGTTQVYCNNGKWETPTILCASTTCWYDHPTWGPVYKGKQAKTKLGYTCNRWTSDSPHNKANLYKDDKAYTVDGSKAAAVNFCRLFKDNHAQAWCYTTHSSKRWDNCEVPHCNEAQACNGPPPRLPRTRVTYTGTKHKDVAHYSCSFTSDVYIKGTTQVYCRNGKWETPTILCASTTCWYDHPTWGPVYKGKQAKTKLGYTCNVWTSDSPHNKANLYKDDKAYTVDGSKAAAVNFCRLFKDKYPQAWCYTTHSSKRWDNCEVPHCNEAQDCNGPPPRLPRTHVMYTGTKHNDVAHYSCSFTSDVYIKGTTQVYCRNGKWETPTILCASTTCWYDHPTWGPVYKGKQAKTKLGYTCNMWTSDSPHNKANLYKDDKAYTVDGSKAAAVNFCRLFKGNHAQAWCYTTHSSKRWDNCHVPRCNEDQVVLLCQPVSEFSDRKIAHVHVREASRSASVSGAIATLMSSYFSNVSWTETIVCRVDPTLVKELVSLEVTMDRDGSRWLLAYINSFMNNTRVSYAREDVVVEGTIYPYNAAASSLNVTSIVTAQEGSPVYTTTCTVVYSSGQTSNRPVVSMADVKMRFHQ